MQVMKKASEQLAQLGHSNLKVVKAINGYVVHDELLPEQTWHATRDTAQECIDDVIQHGIYPKIVCKAGPTPGPWEFRGDEATAEAGLYIDCRNDTGPRLRGHRSYIAGTLATVHFRGAGGWSPVANARLMASAPDMLFALHRVLSILDGTSPRPTIATLGKIEMEVRAVIAKAEGANP